MRILVSSMYSNLTTGMQDRKRKREDLMPASDQHLVPALHIMDSGPTSFVPGELLPKRPHLLVCSTTASCICSGWSSLLNKHCIHAPKLQPAGASAESGAAYVADAEYSQRTPEAITFRSVVYLIHESSAMQHLMPDTPCRYRA